MFLGRFGPMEHFITKRKGQTILIDYINCLFERSLNWVKDMDGFPDIFQSKME